MLNPPVIRTKPQIVLVPGAWHGPEVFGVITSKLESAGYTVHSRQLPSVGSSNPPKDLSEDVAALQGLVTKAIGAGNDVVVVPHSWGGIVVGSALVGYGKKQREASGQKGGVVKGAYMCAFIVDEGTSLMDTVNSQTPTWWKIDGPYSIVTDTSRFYHDIPAEDQRHWAAQLQTHAIAAKQAKATGASWKEFPTTYLLCEDDEAIPAARQEAMTTKVRERGGVIEVERLNSSHSPFLSQPDAVVNWIRRAAGETL